MEYTYKLEMELNEAAAENDEIYDLICGRFDNDRNDVETDENIISVCSDNYDSIIIALGMLYFDNRVQPYFKSVRWYNKKRGNYYYEDVLKEADIYLGKTDLQSEKGSRRRFEISFDKKKLKENYPKKKSDTAYEELGAFLDKHGFDSKTYMSHEKISDTGVGLLIAQLINDFSWFAECLSEFGISDIGKSRDLMPLLKGEMTSEEFNKASEEEDKLEWIKEVKRHHMEFIDFMTMRMKPLLKGEITPQEFQKYFYGDDELKPSEKHLIESACSMVEVAKKEYGRLLTEEEAVKLTDEIRAELREKGEI